MHNVPYYTTIAGAILLLFLTLRHLASGRMHFSFFPPIEADFLAAWLTMPQGTPFEVTEAAVLHLEASVEELRAELDPEFAAEDESLVLHVLASVGSQPFRDRQSRRPMGGSQQAVNDSHLGEVVLELVPSEERGEVALRSRDSAVVQFFDPDNWELLVKVLDGRAVNGFFWVFSAAATNVAFHHFQLHWRETFAIFVKGFVKGRCTNAVTGHKHQAATVQHPQPLHHGDRVVVTGPDEDSGGAELPLHLGGVPPIDRHCERRGPGTARGAVQRHALDLAQPGLNRYHE